MDVEETTYCRIETAKNFIVIPFRPEHYETLRLAAKRGSFTLVIEGMVPVEIPTPPGRG